MIQLRPVRFAGGREILEFVVDLLNMGECLFNIRN